MLQEFKDFAVKGNVIDLAVGVVIGAAFGKIVESLVKDIIMPTIAMIAGKADFSSLHIGPIMYGNFLTNVLDFVIIAFSIFMAVKVINKMGGIKKSEETSTSK